jgi:hypothetical protein
LTITIPFCTLKDMQWQATCLGGTIRMEHALISWGPGAPLLMMAEGIEIRPPEQAVQVIRNHGAAVLQNIGWKLGSFSIRKITAENESWERAKHWASPERMGSLHVESNNRRPVCQLSRCILNNIGMETRATDPRGTMVVVEHVGGVFYDGERTG